MKSPSVASASAWSAEVLERWAFRAAAALGLAAVVFAAWHIARPYPILGQEAAHIQNTVLFAGGENPYASFRPDWLYVYGIGHTLLAYPFALLFGPTFLLHRLLSCACLIGAAFVLYRAMRVDRIAPRLAATGALLFFAHFAFSISIGLNVNSLGVLCYLLSVVIPYACGFGVRSLAVGAAFAVLAFYTKGYFVLGAPLLVLYLFFFRSWRLALLLSAFFAGFLAVTGVVVHHFLPLYFEESILYQYYWAQVYASRLHLFGVLREALPIEAGFLALLVWERWKKGKGAALEFSGFLLLVSFVVYVVALSQNQGNSKAYIFHLCTAFLIWRSILAVSRETGERTPRALLLLAVFLVAGFLALPVIRYGHGDHRAGWERAAAIIRAHRDPLADGCLAQTLRDAGKPVYESGYSEGINYVLANPHLPPSALHKVAARAYLDEIARKLEAKEFDVLLLFPEGSPVLPTGELTRYYHKVESFPLWCSFPYDYKSNIEIWEPLP